MSDEKPSVEVRMVKYIDVEGEMFDEIVAKNASLHMEVMSTAGRLRKKNEYAHIWMRVTGADGKTVIVNLYSDTAISVTAERE